MAAEYDNTPAETGRSQLEQIRLDKLKELQAAGADPFQIVRFQ